MRGNKNHVHVVVLIALLTCASLSTKAQFLLSERADVKNLVDQNAGIIGLSPDEINNCIVADYYYNQNAQTQMMYLQQTHLGIPLHNQLQVIVFKNSKAISVTGGRFAKAAVRANQADGVPAKTPSEALRFALADRNITLPATLPLNTIGVTQNGRKVVYGNLGVAQQNMTVELFWLPLNDNELRLCWQVNIMPKNSSDNWLLRVDAMNGAIISKDNLTISCNWDHADNHLDECFMQQHFENDANKNFSFRGTGAGTGQLIGSATYRVVPFPAESPFAPGGNHTLVNSPWTLSPAGSNATTLKWHTDTTGDWDITRGNNVYAQEDRDNNNLTFGKTPVSSVALPNINMDYTPNYFRPPTPLNTTDSANIKFAITNLFYWNNVIHDFTYLYSFDEPSGNFQSRNMSRGGAALDAVVADASDNGGTSNANFSTPTDGGAPRMQMYLWSAKPARTIYATAPAAFVGYKYAAVSTISGTSTALAAGPVSGNVVFYNDDVAGTLHTGCAAAANASALAGKIALINNNTTCTYAVQVKNAQTAGAIGVIIVNNAAGTPTVITGTDATITIPTVMIGQTDGNSIISYLTASQTVTVTISQVQIDGDMDNGVIAHEYGHGVSNRLTGGPSNTSCLGNAEQMGEGWSDYLGLMMTHDWATAIATDGQNKPRGIGTYVYGAEPNGPGIRTYKYTTDMTINPFTYANVASTSGGAVHYIGSIWCTFLWDVTWALIQTDGINPNLFNPSAPGGNTVAMRLVMEGMRLQPCSPGFVDGRNAILKADSILYGGVHACTIWNAFARRGLGANASQGASSSYTDGTQNFTSKDLPVMVANTNSVNSSTNQLITYNFKVNGACAAQTNLTLVDTLPTNVSYVSGGTYNGADRTVKYNSINVNAGQSLSFPLTVQVNSTASLGSTIHMNEDFATSTLTTSFTTTSSSTELFTISTTYARSAPNSVYASDPTTSSNQVLATTNAYTLTAGATTLSFWHYFSTENTYDGGVIEISTNGGSTWTSLEPYITLNSYNTAMAAGSATTLNSAKAFSGTSGAAGTFINTKVNLNPFVGQSIKIRFRFVSDASIGGVGWFIDDVVLQSEAAVYNKIQLFNSSNVLIASADTITKLISTLPLGWGIFKGEKRRLEVGLTWNTFNEVNTLKFVVQRSTDGSGYVNIGEIKSGGNGNHDYSFVDRNPANGKNYYRLYQVDKDGKFSYSPVVIIDFDNSFVITLAPNPAKDYAYLQAGSNIIKHIQLTNTLGQVLWQSPVNSTSIKIPLQTFERGTYYIRIWTNDETRVIKMLKE
jgi:extracellular elastinolytic metalloproteinase